MSNLWEWWCDNNVDMSRFRRRRPRWLLTATILFFLLLTFYAYALEPGQYYCTVTEDGQGGFINACTPSDEPPPVEPPPSGDYFEDDFSVDDLQNLGDREGWEHYGVLANTIRVEPASDAIQAATAQQDAYMVVHDFGAADHLIEVDYLAGFGISAIMSVTDAQNYVALEVVGTAGAGLRLRSYLAGVPTTHYQGQPVPQSTYRLERAGDGLTLTRDGTEIGTWATPAPAGTRAGVRATGSQGGPVFGRFLHAPLGATTPPPVDCELEPEHPDCPPIVPLPPLVTEPWGVRPTPVWFAALPVGEWSIIGSHTMEDACYTQQPGNCNAGAWRGGAGFQDKVQTWCGAAFCRECAASGEYFAGLCGGHGAQSGNDLYAFDVEMAHWRMVSEPYGALGGQDPSAGYVPPEGETRPEGFYSWWTGTYPDDSPIAAHNMHSSVVVERGEGRQITELVELRSQENPTATGDSGEQRQPIRAHVVDLDIPWNSLMSWSFAGFADPDCEVMPPRQTASTCTRTEYPSGTYDVLREGVWTVPQAWPLGNTEAEPMITLFEPETGAWTPVAPAPSAGWGAPVPLEHIPGYDVLLMANFSYPGLPTGDMYLFDPRHPERGVQRVPWTGNQPAILSHRSSIVHSDVRSGTDRQCVLYFDGEAEGASEVWEFCLTLAEDRTVAAAGWSLLGQGGDAPGKIHNGLGNRLKVARFEDGEAALLVKSTSEPVYAFRVPPRTIASFCGPDDLVCHQFTNQASVDAVYQPPGPGVDDLVLPVWDPEIGGARMTIGGNYKGSVGGTFLFNWSPPTEHGHWQQYKIRFSEEFLAMNYPGKLAVTYHERSCSSHEFATSLGVRPQHYEGCGCCGYVTPIGQNQHDFQPGGITSCLRYDQTLPGKPCYRYRPNLWITMTVHMDFDVGVTRVWFQHEDEPEPTQTIEFPIQTSRRLSSLFIGPYVWPEQEMGRPATEVWVQDVRVLSESPLPPVAAATRHAMDIPPAFPVDPDTFRFLAIE